MGGGTAGATADHRPCTISCSRVKNRSARQICTEMASVSVVGREREGEAPLRIINRTCTRLMEVMASIYDGVKTRQLLVRSQVHSLEGEEHNYARSGDCCRRGAGGNTESLSMLLSEVFTIDDEALTLLTLSQPTGPLDLTSRIHVDTQRVLSTKME